MNRKTRATMGAVILSLLFSGVYLFLFSRLNHSRQADDVEQIRPLSNDQPVIQSVPYKMLHWIQAGVFRYPDSMSELRQQLKEINVDCHDYRKNEIYVLACGLSKNNEETEKARTAMEQAGLEWMRQDCQISEQQDKLLDEGKIKEVLEGCVSRQ